MSSEVKTEKEEYTNIVWIKGQNKSKVTKKYDGDILLIRKQEKFSNGDTVIVKEKEKEKSIMRVCEVDKRLYLLDENKNGELINISNKGIKILGKVEKSITTF